MNVRHHPAVQIIPIAVLLLAGCNTSLSVPGDQGSTPVGTQGGFPTIPPAGGSSGNPAGDPMGDTPGGMVGGTEGSPAGMPSGSTGGGIGSGDLDEVLDKSLGDFDKQMGRERSGVMTGGQGTGGAAGRREDADESAVRTAGMRGGGSGSTGGASSSGASGEGGSAGSRSGGSTGSAGESDGGSRGGDAGGSDTTGAGGAEAGEERVADLPKDITVDESAEDQVARQIREAAQAEKDPVIRDALWEEYRKHMGMK